MTIHYFSLYNCALAGAAAGMSSQRQALLEQSGEPVTPADSDTLLTTCALYAAEVDALLVSLTPSTATNIIDMVSDQLTVAPTTAALSSASAYLPVVMALMSKATFDGRGIPKDAEGFAYDQAEWTASLVPNGVVAYFLAFSENVFPEGESILVPGNVRFIPLVNVAMGGAMAGMISGRQDLYNSSGAELTAANFAVHVATATAFAQEVDAQLGAASLPGNVTGLVSASSPYSTIVPSTAVLSNALYSLIPIMGALCKAIFDGRGIPKDNAGAAFVQADYADIANTVVQQFLSCANFVQTT